MADAEMPETLASIAERITALGRSMDGRFERIDQRFETIDQRFDDLKAQLRLEIERVDSRVMLVYDAVIVLQKQSKANAHDHRRFAERLDNHELRLLALEKRKR